MTGGPLKPIQVIPPGLTGLLQLKQEGRLPDMLSDVVAPVVELRDWYLLARRLETHALFPTLVGDPVVSINTAQPPGTVDVWQNIPDPNGHLNVPPNQVWYVWEFTLEWLSVAASDTIVGLAPAILTPNASGGGASNIVQVGQPQTDIVSARATRAVIAKNDHPFWMSPGDRFAITLNDHVTGAANNLVAGYIRATPCPV